MRAYLLTASISALILAMPAAAQAPWSAAGELGDADSQGAEQRRYDAHPLRLEAGRRYRISVTSEAFDPLAELYRPGQAEPVARDDDSGPGLNASIAFAPTESGDYVLRVTSFSAEGRGAYTAAVALRRPPGPPRPGADSGAGRLEDDFDQYAIRLEAGRRYRISVDSADFDPIAGLYRAGRDEPVAENDDGGDGVNSRLSYVPPESGDYVLRVAAFGGGDGGAYTYRIAPQPPLPPPSTLFSRMEATIWRVYTGTLAASDPDDEGPHFDDYLVHFDAGQERTIRLDAAGFDTVVKVYRVEDREGEALASNDDSGGTLNSMLTYKAEQAGDYVVRATALSATGLGPYRLRVSE
jgi:hypothetical protein